MSTVEASALTTSDTVVLPDGDHAVVNVWLTPNTSYQAGESGPGRGYPSTYVTFEVAGIGDGPGGVAVNNIVFTVPPTQTFTTA
jgi:hypothetical protein